MQFACVNVGISVASDREDLQANCANTLQFSSFMKTEFHLQKYGFPWLCFPCRSFGQISLLGEENTVATVYWNKIYHLLFVNGGSWIANVSHPYTYFILGDLPAHLWFSGVCLRINSSLIPTLPSWASCIQHHWFPGALSSHKCFNEEYVPAAKIFRMLSTIVSNSNLH